MYQVVKLYGDTEPWWFLDGWEEDIVGSCDFETYSDAYLYYKLECGRMAKEFPQQKSKESMMSAFWTPSDQLWCEECDEYLQQYHSIMILKRREGSGTALTGPRKRRCQLK